MEEARVLRDHMLDWGPQYEMQGHLLDRIIHQNVVYGQYHEQLLPLIYLQEGF